MQIEHDITDFVPQPHLIELFRRFVTAAVERSGTNPKAVDRVVICSEDRYGPIIASISPGASYTNNETAVGVGKTLPRRVDGTVVSDIVLLASIFGTFGKVPDGEISPTEWPPEVQQIFYVLCHEFGHVRDYALRDELHDAIDPRSDPFSIPETAEYYGQIVLTEFAACRHASVVVTKALFDLQMANAAERLQAVKKRAQEYLKNQDDYNYTQRTLCHVACQAAWVFLAELAKLYGDGTRQGDLIEEVRVFERDLVEATPLTDVLDRYGAAYPVWHTPDQIEELKEVWHHYGRELLRVEFLRRGNGEDDIEDFA